MAAPGSTGGAILLAVIAAVAFATILAVVAGLTLTSSVSVAHDLYNSVVEARGRRPRRRSSRWPGSPPACIGLVAILLAIPAQKLNIAFLVALAFAIAASANLPAIVYNMFWKRLQHPRRGVEHLRRPDLLGRPGDLLARSCPARASTPSPGKNLSLLPTSIDISWFPLENPGIVSIPLGFLLGYLGIGHLARSRTPRSATPSSRCAR